MSKIKNGLKLIATMGIGVSTIAGFVADFFYPIAPYSLYILLAIVLAFSASLIFRVFPPLNKSAAQAIPEYWYAPFALTLGASFIVILASYSISESYSQTGGYLASEFELVKTMQHDVGLISENVQRIAQSTEEISMKMDNVKKEVSEHPRKELNNMGIPWNDKEFGVAISNGDLGVIDLFIKGGMSIQTAQSKYTFGNAVGYLLKDVESGGPTFDHLIQKGGYKLNSTVPSMGSVVHAAVLGVYKDDIAALSWLIDRDIDLNVKKTVSKVNWYESFNINGYSFDSATPLCVLDFRRVAVNAHLAIGKYDSGEINRLEKELSRLERVSDFLKSNGAKSQGSAKVRESISVESHDSKMWLGCHLKVQCPVASLSDYDQTPEICPNYY